MQQNTEQMLLT